MEHLWYFLTDSIFGWWILFLVFGSLFSFLAHHVRRWNRKRRFMTSQHARLQNPGDAEVRFLLAQIYAENKSWKKSETMVDEAIVIAGGSKLYNHVPHKFLRLKGECRYARSDFAGAAAAFRKSLDVPSDSGYDKALIGVSRSEWGAGQPEAALEFAKHALAENTSLLEGYFRWAQSADALGKPDERERAAAEFRKVAAILPAFSAQKRFRWRLAFAFFGIAKRLA